MNVLYDHQIFTHQQYGGISRYFFELIKRFDGVNHNCEVGTLFTDNAYYNKSFNPRLNRGLPIVDFRGKKRLTNYLNAKQSARVIGKGNYDVLHPTYYDPMIIDKVGQKPFVVTFYDMIHEKFANQFDGFTEDTELFEAKRKLLERSSKVIAISETTKEDIVSIFGVDRSKIEVVYLGNSLTPFIQGTVRLIAEDYVLFVGNRAAYKNFSFLVKAIADQLIDSNVKLICAGGGAFTFEEQRLIQVLGLEEYVCFKPIGSDTDLANYYSNALFFVFPSLYEGFGIPVLESFACNCPTLLSTGGSLPEIGGDAALYFDPSNAESLREAFRQLLEQEALRAVLKTKGARRLEAFSWDTTFRDTLAIYQSVLR